ncbi:MAG: universal stress protein [Deltaproteobacteria bacterium]|nr:universal stress protein [Deltaproteobacteria bacterium]
MRVHFRQIMCATDFSDISGHAVSYGIALAGEFKAKLILCHVIDLTSASMYGEAALAVEEQRTRMQADALEDLVRRMGDPPVEWEPVVAVGHAAQVITGIAGERGVDLVISGSHGRSGLKAFLLGSVTQRLMRTLPCPLLVIRSPECGFVSSEGSRITLKNILVGCDFSSDSDLAVQYGLSLAQEFQSQLHLVHVIEPPIYEDMLASPAGTDEAVRQDLRDILREKLSSLIPEEAHTWCTPVPVLLAGQPHEELTKYAIVHDMNLIVLGVRGHGLVETLLVGSTTDRVLCRALCPVLSVRPTEG